MEGWKESNQSLLHAKANKFSRNALTDSKPPAVTAHNTAFKSPITIMSKFYHSGQRIAFSQPQIRQVRFLGTQGTSRSSTDLKIRRLATAFARAKHRGRFSSQPWVFRCARDPPHRIAVAPKHPRLGTEPRVGAALLLLQIATLCRSSS